MSVSGGQSSESSSGMRDRAQQMAGRVVDKVQETAGRITGTNQAGDMAGGTASGSQATPVMEQAAEQVTSRMDMGKDYVVEAVSGVAQALRQTGQQLREEGAQTTLAGYVDRGAEQIETFGGYLRGRDSSQIITDVEGFARRQPLVFAGSAFALGMLAVRFFRTESPTTRQTLDISGIDTVWRGLIWQRLAHAVFCLAATIPGMTPGSTAPTPRTSTGTGQVGSNLTRPLNGRPHRVVGPALVPAPERIDLGTEHQHPRVAAPSDAACFAIGR